MRVLSSWNLPRPRRGHPQSLAASKTSTVCVAIFAQPRIREGGVLRGSAPKVTTKRHEPTSVIFTRTNPGQPGRRRAGGGGMRPRCASICDYLRLFAPGRIFNFCAGGAKIGYTFDASRRVFFWGNFRSPGRCSAGGSACTESAKCNALGNVTVAATQPPTLPSKGITGRNRRNKYAATGAPAMPRTT